MSEEKYEQYNERLTSNGDVGTLGDMTPLASRSVFATKSVALGVLVTTWVFANAALGSVLDTDSALDDS